MKKNILKSVLFLLIVSFSVFSCDFMSDDSSSGTKVSSCGFQDTDISLSVGETKQVLFNILPESAYSEVKVSYSVSDTSSEIISLSGESSNGLIVTALKSGSCTIIAKCEGFTSYLTVNVTGSQEDLDPYIVLPYSVLEMTQGERNSLSVSLYNGSSSDVNNFEYSSDNEDVISVEGAGKTVVLTAKSVGKSYVTITHPKAKYSARLLVYSERGSVKPCYITTSQNVFQVGLDDDIKNVTVNLVGSSKNDLSLFAFTIVDGSDVFSLTYNNNICSIIPKKQGTGLIEVTHPDSDVSLQIQVVIIKTVSEPYITSDNSFVEITDKSGKVVTCSVVESSVSSVNYDFSYEITDDSIIKVTQVNNAFYIEPLKDGKAKLIVKNKNTLFPHEIFVVVNGVNEILSKYYITTSQNVIRMEVGDEKTLTMLLSGGNESDKNNFSWTVENKNIIEVESSYGTVNYTRAAVSVDDILTANAIITAKKVGSSFIDVTNPKSGIPARVLVKVYKKGTLDGLGISASGEGIVEAIIGEETKYSVTLSGETANEISWSVEEESLAEVSGDSVDCVITAKNSGVGKLIAKNDDFVRDFSAVLLCGTKEEIAEMKAIYVDNLYPEIFVGVPTFIEIKAKGEIEDSSGYKVSVSDVDIVSARMSGNVLILTGLKSGTTELTVTHPESKTSITLFLTVSDNVTVDKPYYFTYDKMVGIVVGNTKDVEVTLNGAGEKDSNLISWEGDETDVFSFSGNGNVCRVKAESVGEGYIKAHSDKSATDAKILIYTAETEEELKSKVVLTSDKTNYLSYIGNDLYLKVYVSNEEENREKIQWSVDDISICKVDSNYDDAYVRCIGKGNCTVTVTCESAELKFFISVKETEEEVLEADIVVPSILELLNGSTKMIEAATSGLSEDEIANIEWESSDEKVCVVKGNGDVGYLSICGSGFNCVYVSVRLKERGIERKIQIVTADTEEELKTAVVMALSKSYYTLSVGDTLDLSLTFGTNKPTDEVKANIKWESGSESISLSSNGDSCSVYGKTEGIAVIKISGEGIVNSLEIKIAVGESESGYYISVPKKMYGIVNGKTEDIECSICNSLGESVESENGKFSFELSDSSIASFYQSSNIVSVTAVATGRTVLTISHPLAGNVSILIYTADTEDELNGLSPLFATKTAYLIKEGEKCVLTVLYEGKEEIKWSASDTNSSHIDYSIGDDKKTLTVKGIKSGIYTFTAYIGSSLTSSDEKIEFTVSVTDYGSTSSVSLLTESIVGVKKDESYTTTVQTSLSDTEAENLKWTVEDSSICEIVGSGTKCMIKGLKKGVTEIKVSYTSSLYRTIVCYVGETDDELKSYECFNIDKRYNVIGLGGSVSFTPFYAKKVCDTTKTTIEDKYKNNVCSVTEKDGKFTFKGLNEGIAVYTFKNEEALNSSFDVYIEVNSSVSSVESVDTGYLTSQKTVYILGLNDKTSYASLKVYPCDIEESLYTNLTWVCSDDSICSIIPNITECKVYPNKEGEAVVSCSSINSQNVLSFRIIVVEDESALLPYIKVSSSALEVKQGGITDDTVTLVNVDNFDSSKITYKIEDESICSITTIGNILRVRGLSQGQTRLILGYSDEENGVTDVTDVSVIVSVVGVADNLIYLTTDDNYSIMSEGESKTLTVSLSGYDEYNSSNYTWTIDSYESDEEGKEVIKLTGEGNQRRCESLSSGYARIKVVHSSGDNSALYPLYLSVRVLDYEEVNPIYIKTETNVVTLTEGERLTLDVDLVNGKESRYNEFVWENGNDEVLSMQYSGKQAVIKGLEGGKSCSLSVTHPDAIGQVLNIIVIVEPKEDEDGLYITTDSTVLEMKPTDTNRQINVTLVGGKASDSSLFSWEVVSENSIERNKDGTTKGVITINASQDTCLISAKNEGTGVIRVKNSKTSHYLDIKVVVSSYSKFTFSSSSLSLMQTESSIIKVNTPTGKNVVYESSNTDVCSVTGTNSVCMIDAIGLGTCVIRGYLTDNSSEDEVIVQVTKNTNDKPYYITVSHNILSLNTLDNQDGIKVTAKVNNTDDSLLDSQKIKWTTGSKTSDIIKFVSTDPINFEGEECAILPVKAGTDTVYLTYTDGEKSCSKTIYCQVEEDEAVLSLDPVYVSMSKNDVESLTCSISGASESEYENVKWASTDSTICKIVGDTTGEMVTIKAVANGETTISCSYGSIVKYVSIFIKDEYSILVPGGAMKIALGQEALCQVCVTPDEEEYYEEMQVSQSSSSYWALDLNNATYLDDGYKRVGKCLEKNGVYYVPIKATSLAGVATLTCTFKGLSASVNITTTDEVTMKIVSYTEYYSDGTNGTPVMAPLQISADVDCEYIKCYYSVFPANTKFDEMNFSGIINIANMEDAGLYMKSDMKGLCGNDNIMNIDWGDDGVPYFVIYPYQSFSGDLEFKNGDNNFSSGIIPICFTKKDYDPEVSFTFVSKGKSSYDEDNGILNIASSYDTTQRENVKVSFVNYGKMNPRFVFNPDDEDVMYYKSTTTGNANGLGDNIFKPTDNNTYVKEVSTNGGIARTGTRKGVEYEGTVILKILYPKYPGSESDLGVKYLKILVNLDKYE